MVQEEATKLSKRAQRRAAGEGADEGAAAEGTSESEPGDNPDEAAAEGAAPGGATAPAPNRQQRRTAAAKARAMRKQERAEATAIGLDAAEIVDDALVRFTDKAGRLARRHWGWIQWVIGLGMISALGYHLYSWRANISAGKLTDALALALAQENGTIGDPEQQGKVNANGVIDPTPIFEDDAARLNAALASYERAASQAANDPVGAFARLGQAGVAFELGKHDEALAAYDQVIAGSPAKAEAIILASALEGRGLVLEAKKDLPGALQAFEKLASVPGYENRALYQQARIKHALGDAAAAKAALNQLFSALGPPKAASFGGLPERTEFLRERAEQLASSVDPLEKDVKVPKPPMGADAVQQMLEQLQKSGAVQPAAPAP